MTKESETTAMLAFGDGDPESYTVKHWHWVTPHGRGEIGRSNKRRVPNWRLELPDHDVVQDTVGQYTARPKAR